jgi:hypothetical protein
MTLVCMKAPGKGWKLAMWPLGADGGEGGRISTRQLSFLAGEAARENHVATWTRLVAGNWAGRVPASGHDGARLRRPLRARLRRGRGSAGATRGPGGCGGRLWWRWCAPNGRLRLGTGSLPLRRPWWLGGEQGVDARACTRNGRSWRLLLVLVDGGGKPSLDL